MKGCVSVLDEPLSTIYFYLLLSIVITLITFFYSENKIKLHNVSKWLLIIENLLPFIYIFINAFLNSMDGMTYIPGWNSELYGSEAFVLTVLHYILYIWFTLIIHIAILIYIGKNSNLNKKHKQNHE